jgi:hypothetical protein
VLYNILFKKCPLSFYVATIFLLKNLLSRTTIKKKNLYIFCIILKDVVYIYLISIAYSQFPILPSLSILSQMLDQWRAFLAGPTCPMGLRPKSVVVIHPAGYEGT